MFKHRHPYAPFIPDSTTKLIVGTLPPPRFSKGILKPGDVDFCYGSIDGLLWPILNTIFNLNLDFETTEAAILQRKVFLKSRNIGICDIVESAEREKIDASDLGMKNIVLRDVVSYLKYYPKIDTLLFTGGNSKNGPEYFFRKHLKSYGIPLKVEQKEVPREHSFELEGRCINTVSLTAPSGAANRAVGGMPFYKQIKQTNTNFNTFDFRVLQYRNFF
ncbi:G:T/U mismatch-specific uracil/thymine DNA-glyco sylase [Formosa agariphila KMM 3901]|uniref:G:T/U mismatch-specific uracil/thymine DNA-glyco sylase n=1 Tax=Formosa agariphila (strain DSM 15362 / KCTC 12365 / LMG 23005 / KMM 3901 / M-2Alg 35-1) TaxID=1347342 RepID=T2KK20_FORAG|nr:uracil-DNA glycosylase family protein [Formosa agariphila]CDF78334.1 G:T/U mismatch-specific uracil/thymine DNA-glyco sylase [Formosa agariphila KMM 3901]